MALVFRISYLTQSWPDLIRPSTSSFLLCDKDVDTRVKPAHDEWGMEREQ